MRRAGAYVALTKPRVIELLLVTTVPTMILAADGLPSFWLIVATLIGGAGAAGSANAFNMWWDRDIDQVMNRTKKRPLATGEITPRAGLVFASILGLLSLAWFALVINWAAMWLTLGAIAIYVVGYTIAMIACSLALTPLAGMSWVYTVVAAVLGGWFLWSTIAMLRRAQGKASGKLGAMKVFHGSITYLSLLFVAVAVDVFLPF